MMNCRQASQLVSQSLDRRLSWRERFGLRLHLLICDACAEFQRQMRLLRAATQRLTAASLADITLPTAARERIERTLARLRSP